MFRFISVSKIDSALKLSPEEFRYIYHYDKPLTNDCHIVFHCKSGVRSAHALYIAKQNGYKWCVCFFILVLVY